MKKYSEIVSFLETLQIMPKTMPGLDKIKRALVQTDWYASLDPFKIIVVAGTNGKGSTCAMLESLLIEADQAVGFYSSPHLISTTERIRTSGAQLSEDIFIEVFTDCEKLIKECELSHFESLTLMAGHYFFSSKWNQNLDFVIFEVGLGGTYDATNAFPHAYSVITPLGLDHTAILGNTLAEVAQNKFGIIQAGNVVIHQGFSNSLMPLKKDVEEETNSKWYEVPVAQCRVAKNSNEPKYFVKTIWGEAALALPGERAAQNAMTALYTFEKLGFSPLLYLDALADTNWPGRMQKISWPNITCPVYLSGDHNPDGIISLLKILKDFSWHTLHVIVGIGVDKDADEMLEELSELPNMNLYLTATPFKGLKLNEYPQKYLFQSTDRNADVIEILNTIDCAPNDLVLVTGSLYLVGKVLKNLKT
ncbi:MAG: hypothetical protein H7328_05305 [Bdellovibrio sp.]|nr:hypothetical protein [Bdellovibrio sp.]